MVKFSKWVLVFVCSVLAFSCSTSKEITLSNDKVKLQTEASISNGVIDNERVHTISFASMVETTNQLDFKEIENPPLFKAIPDSVWEYLPTIAEQRQSLQEDEALVNADPPAEPIRNPNYYANKSLTFGYIALGTAITVYGGFICSIIGFIYARKSKKAKEPNIKLARSGKIINILAFILSYICTVFWVFVLISML